LYKIFQLLALAWDVDGDGVVEVWEVALALKFIFLGFIYKLRAIVQRLRRKPVLEEPAWYATHPLEWRPAFFGVFQSFADLELMQKFLGSDYHGPEDELTDKTELGGAADDADLHIALGRYFADARKYKSKKITVNPYIAYIRECEWLYDRPSHKSGGTD
jgi:hypothetical protein